MLLELTKDIPGFESMKMALQKHINKYFKEVEKHEIWSWEEYGMPSVLTLPVLFEKCTAYKVIDQNFPPSVKYLPSSAFMVEIMLRVWIGQSSEIEFTKLFGDQKSKTAIEKARASRVARTSDPWKAQIRDESTEKDQLPSWRKE